MIGKLKSFTLKVIAGINIVAVIAMMISGYSSLFHPQDYPTISILGLLFPFFVIVNLIFLLFWVIFKLKGILIPVIGLLLCLPPIRDYLPLNFQQVPPDGSLKVISYNVYLFAPWDVKKDEPNPILEYLRHHLPARGRDQRDGQQQATSGNEHIPLSRLHENGKCL